MQLNNQDIKNILFIDIETVPLAETFDQLNDTMQKAITIALNKQNDNTQKNKTIEELYLENGGIKSEYSKVICIGLAYLYTENDLLKIQTKVIGCRDIYQNEKDILNEFCTLINEKFAHKKLVFCGHNIAEFDIPFLSRRMLINGIPIPAKMNYQGLKPWQVEILDTLQLWKFGDIKNQVSLDLLCAVFDIPTPKKEDISGSKIKETFYIKKDLKKIRQYCIDDVIAVIQLLLKYNIQPIIPEQQIALNFE